MRFFLVSLTAAVLLLLLLYAGLNQVERSMHELMGLEHESAAFTLRRQDNGSVEITFSGDTVSLDTSAVVRAVRKWLEKLP